MGLALGVLGGHISDTTLADTKEGTAPRSLPYRPYKLVSEGSILPSCASRVGAAVAHTGENSVVEKAGIASLPSKCMSHMLVDGPVAHLSVGGGDGGMEDSAQVIATRVRLPLGCHTEHQPQAREECPRGS
jgi:hypothetical protein